MGEIEVLIDNDSGDFSVLVKNTREDLFHDFQYFLEQAEKHDPMVPEAMFLHARFLRVALLSLFAYAEAIVNGWLNALLEEKAVGVLFTRIQRDSLDKKIDLLNELGSAKVQKPNVNDARKIRNLFAHFTPTREEEAFSKLTMPAVKKAADELLRWITEMESTLNLKRHASSEELSRAFADIGTTIQEVSTDPTR